MVTVERQVDRAYTAHYPVSGRRLEVRGQLLAGELGGEFTVGFVLSHGAYVGGKWVPPGSVYIIDPRCYVTCSEGEAHYDPRDYLKEMQPTFRRWLRKNPWWRAPVEAA